MSFTPDERDTIRRAKLIRAIQDNLARLDGSDLAAVALLTGLTPDELRELGGL